MSESRPSSRWWGEFAFEHKDTRLWHVGPRRMIVRRLAREYRVWIWAEGDAMSDALRVAEPFGERAPADAELERFGFEASPGSFHLHPMHADRPIVTRPENPFHLPPRERTTIYVSCPLWLQLRATADGAPVDERPLHRPSDTWFGPNTRVGELCYSDRTSARLNLENVAIRPHRAVAAVTIQNRAAETLDLQRIKLPAPHLSLHCGETGHLWTEGVTLINTAEGDQAEMELDGTPPPEAGATTFVAGPRLRHGRSALLRAFGRVLGRPGALHG